MTVNEAYEKIKKEIPDLKTNIIEDWGPFYAVTNGEEGDMVDDDWKIDKKTGKISEFSIDDMSREMQKHSDDWYPTAYKI